MTEPIPQTDIDLPLTPKQKIIFDMYMSGMLQREIGEYFGAPKPQSFAGKFITAVAKRGPTYRKAIWQRKCKNWERLHQGEKDYTNKWKEAAEELKKRTTSH